MSVVADECVLRAIVDRLRADGHSVRSIRLTDGGAADPKVLAVAVAEGAVLITQDKDCGELVYRHAMPNCGVVLLRLAGLPFDERAELVSHVCRDNAADLPAAFTVIGVNGVRIRLLNRPPDPPAS